MLLKKKILLFLAVLMIVGNAYADDCASIFQHYHDPSDGKTKTFITDDSALYGYDNCNYTQKEFTVLTPIKSRGLDFRVNTRNFSKFQRSKLMNALSRLKRAINSQQFKRKVLSYRYNGKLRYANNKGKSNLQIYNQIMRGAEKLIPKSDGEMDLDITLYYEDTPVIGYTYPTTTRIWVNSKFFNKFSYASIAGNITHEWLHKIGFGHDFDRTARRSHSVPYAVGKILRSLI